MCDDITAYLQISLVFFSIADNNLIVSKICLYKNIHKSTNSTLDKYIYTLTSERFENMFKEPSWKQTGIKYNLL